jgi:hypothetical protein
LSALSISSVFWAISRRTRPGWLFPVIKQFAFRTPVGRGWRSHDHDQKEASLAIETVRISPFERTIGQVGCFTSHVSTDLDKPFDVSLGFAKDSGLLRDRGCVCSFFSPSTDDHADIVAADAPGIDRSVCEQLYYRAVRQSTVPAVIKSVTLIMMGPSSNHS